ncbi:hypothetical protein [Arthrobacter sp. MMS18-M83]|uniref:hypothetical protein n=1 Tax=Arthrobacter sp. MMS18-M83 TaxID=2996261 RepID=UPI00227C3E40|nr:hypothetical protein [Arthrobacter sp. MMS18-M83]WAH95667.1 hypothetical protein OW521_14565 [Arthrobacter sp. MMS18-M83]
MKVGMNLSSPWITGVISSLAAFLLAYSIESFRSLPLFWVLYVGMGAAWLAVAATQTTDKSHTILSIPTPLLMLGIISLVINFFPLALALFIVFVNTLMLAPNNRGWRLLGDALESLVYVFFAFFFAFVFFLVSGFMPRVVVPVAYVLAGIAIIASIKRAEAGSFPKWTGTLAGLALVVVLVVFNDRYASIGAATAAAGVALLVGIGKATRSNRRWPASSAR